MHECFLQKTCFIVTYAVYGSKTELRIDITQNSD